MNEQALKYINTIIDAAPDNSLKIIEKSLIEKQQIGREEAHMGAVDTKKSLKYRLGVNRNNLEEEQIFSAFVNSWQQQENRYEQKRAKINRLFIYSIILAIVYILLSLILTNSIGVNSIIIFGISFLGIIGLLILGFVYQLEFKQLHTEQENLRFFQLLIAKLEIVLALPEGKLKEGSMQRLSEHFSQKHYYSYQIVHNMKQYNIGKEASQDLTSKQFISHIRSLLAKDKIEDAIQLLKQLLEKSPQLDETIQQDGRLNAVRKQVRLGTISYENANLTRNQIREGVLNFIRKIEAQMDNPNIQSEVEEVATANKSIIQNAEKIYNIEKIDVANFS